LPPIGNIENALQGIHVGARPHGHSSCRDIRHRQDLYLRPTTRRPSAEDYVKNDTPVDESSAGPDPNAPPVRKLDLDAAVSGADLFALERILDILDRR
jgi:hypothetical protein